MYLVPKYIQSTPSLSQSKGLVFSFEITEFCYKGSNICAIQALGEKIHFDISDQSQPIYEVINAVKILGEALKK